MLFNEGYNLTDFQGLLDIQAEICTEEVNDINIVEHINIGEQNYAKLNVKQKLVVDYVLDALKDSSFDGLMVLIC